MPQNRKNINNLTKITKKYFYQKHDHHHTKPSYPTRSQSTIHDLICHKQHTKLAAAAQQLPLSNLASKHNLAYVAKAATPPAITC